MTDDHSSFDDIAEDQGEPRHGRRHGGRGRRPSRSRSVLPVVLVLVMLLALGGAGLYGYSWLTSNVNVGETEAEDYPGPGSGEVIVGVEDGDTGSDIAATLVENDVIASPGPFVTVFSNTPEAGQIHPGTYRLQQQMSSQQALDALLDPENRAGFTVTIPEGLRMSAIFERLAEETGIPVEDFEAVAEDYTSLGIPENEADSAEGYLWPGQYDFREDATAEDILQTMWDRMEAQLEERGVAPDEYVRVLTIASIVEREARDPDDFGKVVRTVENRLAGVGEADGRPMPLQLDSTVNYFSGGTTVSTTPEDRATDNPYNTYLHPGLPIGPIANPGAGALDATLNPPEGDWLYWVTVNTETGETKFAETIEEHDRNVAEWREWARDR